MKKILSLLGMSSLCLLTASAQTTFNDVFGNSGRGQVGGSDNAQLTRGPYLQMGNQTAVSLRWRTDVATDSKMEVGTAAGVYTLSATNSLKVTEHEVRISGLAPDTKYYYRFGSSTHSLQSGPANFFHTAPPPNTTRRIRIAAFGDCGTNANGYQVGSLSSYMERTGANPAEVLLLLGDNAYQDGTDAQYQAKFFNVYSPNILKNHVLFSAPGNHDYHTTTQAARTAPYYKNFSMPTAGECGGVPSGTKSYYAFDWGNIHFISLDSYGTENGKRMSDTTGAQASWLKKDLDANRREWVVVYFHHPPYTKGSHDSDGEGELVAIRSRFIRILERYGVDLVLTGHSHDYERSYLLNNHYGKESSFSPAAHAISTSSAKYDGSSNSCPYVTATGKGNKGTVYVVSGSAGNSGDLASGWPHNALPFAFNDGGMLYLEVEDNRLDGQFLRKNGSVADRFTLLHDVNKTSSISVPSGQSRQLTASWIGNYKWSTGATTRSITVRPGDNATYKVVDDQGCLHDAFNVVVTNAAITAVPSAEMERTAAVPALRAYPTLVHRGAPISLQVSWEEPVQMEVLDNHGHTVFSLKFTRNASLETGALPAGVYYLKAKGKDKVPAQRLVIME
ncbi:metallophosphoesterase [Paraflavisolibacter sp. H34]|uniref:metallophosphoesterase n=1 Tax=Huijunlia imazamoxiresistens TaxID=3127457 RepID=UPI003016AC86